MLHGKAVLGSLLMTFGLIALTGTGVQAQSGSLEPPGSAVNGSGEPVPTTQTQPSWDQALPSSERFKLVMGREAALDKETGLVWEQSPRTNAIPWYVARGLCTGRTVGGKKGWRLPSVHELGSLVDPTNSRPTLPTDHPFSNVQSSAYWSATTDVQIPTAAWLVSFLNGLVGSNGKAFTFFVWCVRGGGPLSEY